MIFNPRKLFVIVGYPHTGKTKTLQQIFHRKHFFPYKQPISTAYFGAEKFIVINISDHNHRTANYLLRIKDVMKYHTETQAYFLVVISMAFDNSNRDVKNILAYFNQSGWDIHYLLLSSSWYDKSIIKEQDVILFKQLIERGRIHILERLVTLSPIRFNERVEEVKEVILKALEQKVVMLS
ncbi:hypothetical protein ACDQ55_03755 [Chitinophaga sp. 30R24]|uniref:hypothetical protein n=1 Tax=Chitinophaga sp. 30R24 TaxID=3248838 RepID=UPI003B8F6E49